MNWNRRYAMERKWQTIPTVAPTNSIVDMTPKPGRQFTSVTPIQNLQSKMSHDWKEWSTRQLPGVPQGKKVTGFTGEVTNEGGGSSYTAGDDGKWTKTLSPQAQARYRSTRPGVYDTVNSQGLYTSKSENTVFIHPEHLDAIGRVMKDSDPVAHKLSDGSFEYHGFGLVNGLPETSIVNRSTSNPNFGRYRIPQNHISMSPFTGAIPFQHGLTTLADGSTKRGQHIGNAVGEIHYELE